MGVMTIGEFKAQSDEALARAAAGEIIEITKNNLTIAELRPKRGAHDAEWNAASRGMIDLMRTGFSLGGGPFTTEDKHGRTAL